MSETDYDAIATTVFLKAKLNFSGTWYMTTEDQATFIAAVAQRMREREEKLELKIASLEAELENYRRKN